MTKILILFLIFFHFIPYVSKAQSIEDQLNIADSLFRQKKYMESFDSYQNVYESGYYSPSMLLRMAYIREGLGDYTNSLLYLNQYYLKTIDRQTLEKMEKLAKKHKLQGYFSTDFDFFAAWYHKYYNQLLLLMGAMVILLSSILVYKKRRGEERPWAAFVILILISGVFIGLVNFQHFERKAIISSNNTYLMSAPSAGSDLVEVIQKGHRVDLLEKHDVWQAIEWGDQQVYLREDQIKRIQ